MPIGVAVSALQLATEDRTGYQRTSFEHWSTGANASDGCNTRMEVLIAEAVEAPEVGPGCTLTGGVWWSYYDERPVTSAGALDIDHMVPLAEAWGSGASAWTAARREAYANDLGQEASLVAVTARSNTVTAVIENLAQDSPTAAALKAARTLELIAQQRRNGEQHLLHGLAGCPAHDHCGGALCPHRGTDTSPVGRALR